MHLIFDTSQEAYHQLMQRMRRLMAAWAAAGSAARTPAGSRILLPRQYSLTQAGTCIDLVDRHLRLRRAAAGRVHRLAADDRVIVSAERIASASRTKRMLGRSFRSHMPFADMGSEMDSSRCPGRTPACRTHSHAHRAVA